MSAKAAVARKRKISGVSMAEANDSARGLPSGLRIDLNRINEEYVPALKNWPARIDLYQKMSNDAKIAAQLRASILPVISAVKWSVRGGDSEARDHVAANLMREGPQQFWCDTSWTQRVFESFQFLKYGLAIFHKTREIVEGKMIFRRLTYLHPRSLGGPSGPWEWNDAGTQLVALHRAYTKPNQQTVFDERIPIDDLSVFVWGLTGENWEGEPLIRSMYRAWVEKDLASKIQMVDLQNRGVGIPDVELAPNDGKTERDTLVQIAKDLRGGSKERQFVVRGSGQKVGFMTSQGTVLDATPIISAKNNEFAAGAGTDFQQQGQTQSGSRATGSVLMVSYMQQLEAARVIFQDQVNHGAGNLQGQVEELVYENFGDVECPQIVGTCVAPTDQLDNVPNILDAVQKGGLTHDLELENHVRRSLGVKEMSAEDFQKAKDENKPAPNIGGRPNEVGPSDAEDPRDDSTGRAFGLQEKKTLLAGNRQNRSAASYRWLT